MLQQVFKDAEAKMAKAVEATRQEFASIRTGRASTALLDRLTVEAYGQEMPLKQLATVTTPDVRSLVIQPFDKNTVGEVRKAIEKSDLGLTPNVDGAVIRLVVPALTEERRRDLVKVVRKKGEEGKVAVRNIRHKAVDELKALLKDGQVTEDDQKRGQDHVQKLTDKYAKDVDALVAHKEKEIMEV
ncbi:MAG TPA: ribosome recycling factor [Candidatus Dormibacteraeota bacterium]|nr:ribosome recycling factor [Candidatus Dormibacteraeota bacterium]